MVLFLWSSDGSKIYLFQKFQHCNNKLQTSMSQKTFFASTEYRNAKYQGAIRGGSPDGLALYFDNQHLFTLSNFKKDVPYGPTLVVFPNRDYLYGKIKNKALQSICVFVKASGQTYVMDFANGQSNKIAYADNNNIVIEFFYKDGKLRIGETRSYKEKGSTKWNLLSEILGKQIPPYFCSYKSYIQETLERQFQDVVECSEISGLTFLGFKNTPSLGVKFSKDDRVQQVGFFQLFPRNLEFGRKYMFDSISNKIEEGRFVEPERIFTYERRQQRPIEAARYTEQYFKRGTNFKNSFFKVTFFDDIVKYLTKLEKQVGSLEFVQFGQKILEGSDQERNEEPQVYYRNKEYTIQEVKKQILDAVKKKNLGGKRGSAALQHSREKLRTSRQKLPMYHKASVPNQIIQHSPPNRSLSRNKRYDYSRKIAKEVPGGRYYAEMSQKRQRSPIPVPDYYPNSQKKVLPYFSNVSPGNKTYIYEHRPINNLYQRQKVRQQALLDKARRNVSPLRQRASTAYIYSPYDRLLQVRVPQRQDNPATIEAQHFTLGKNNDEYNNYLKYKNRHKTPVKQSRSPYKPEIGRKVEYQAPKEPVVEKKVLLTGQFLQLKPQKQKQKQKQKELAGQKSKNDLVLPARYKKQFKYF